MIIADLEHNEIICPTNKLKKIEGSVSLLSFSTKFLALGTSNSVAQVLTSSFLSVSAPGSNISSGEFLLVLGAD
ncbi:hypothetical protein VB715_21075 [Crocosphaera sp. UHCC 0190]|uniref:hypothetical protein n=1 Tax=Crocosphaera sp. UHCC 0190 TaxID=3110246 RepID=UPI002B1F6B19|nr:hypothetical protein [Crocosphaera sp. UHCC 0190]MEA5512268.1 hypothetical protein [Crocosphaera sp. UHCC 0190]